MWHSISGTAENITIVCPVLYNAGNIQNLWFALNVPKTVAAKQVWSV
jgi:hypothetical protein